MKSQTCDSQIRTTLLRLKRLLHSRLHVCISRSPDQTPIKPTLHVFTSAVEHSIPTPFQGKQSREHLSVQTYLPLTDKHTSALRDQILTCLNKQCCVEMEEDLPDSSVIFVQILSATDSENSVVQECPRFPFHQDILASGLCHQVRWSVIY